MNERINVNKGAEERGNDQIIEHLEFVFLTDASKTVRNENISKSSLYNAVKNFK